MIFFLCHWKEVFHTEIFKLFGSIMVNNDAANQALDDTDKKAENTSNTLGGLIGKAAAVGAGIAAGLAVAGGALLGLVNKTAEAAMMIDKFSQVAGFSTKGFQEWDYVMKSVGYSMEDASGDMAALAEKALEAATGAGEGAEWFGMLGIKATDAGGKLKSQEVIFGEVITSLQGMEDITKRNAIATALMGTTGEELGPILNMTGAELEGMKNKASELSVVMSQDAVDANVKYAKTVEEAKGTIGALGTQISNQLLPTFQGMLDWIIANMPAIQNEIEYAMGLAGDAINKVGVAITETKEFFTEHWKIVEPILAGIAAGAITIGTMTAATKLWTLATQAATVAQAALNVVMNLSPWAKVALLIGALVTAGVALYRNWDTIKLKAKELWTAIDVAFKNGVNGAIDMINSLIKQINKIPGVDAPLIARVKVITENKSSAKSVDDRLGNNAQGTDYWRGGLTWVGEQGPEIVNLPRGSQVYDNGESMRMASVGVTPGGVTVNINGANIKDDYGVDRLMDRVMDRLALKGVR